MFGSSISHRAFPIELYYVAKKCVAKHPLGRVSRYLNTFYIKQDKPLLMFPAGTRAKDGSIGILKPGVA